MAASNEDLRRRLEALTMRLMQIERRHEQDVGMLRSQLDELRLGLAAAEVEESFLPPPLPEVEQVPEPAAGEMAAVEAMSATPADRRKVRLVIESAPMQVAEEAPKPVQPEQRGSMEVNFGTVWLVRIGIAMLLTGLVLLGNYAYRNWIHDLPNGVRLTGLYACAALLGGTGLWLGKRPGLQRYGEVLLAGGLAFFYYCTYAAHQVPRLRVIDSPVVAGCCLFGAAALITVMARMRKSPGTAVMGFILASYATMLQPLGWLAACSNLMLAMAGVCLLAQAGWVAPGVVSMIGTYLAFTGWQIFGASQGDLRDPAVLWFLPPTWLVFALPALLGRFREVLSERARAWYTAGNNGGFYALFSYLWIVQRGESDYWQVAGVIGAIYLALGVWARRQPGATGSVSIAQGLAVLMLATILKFHGHGLALWLAAEALLLALAHRRFQHRTELIGAVVMGVLAFGAAEIDRLQADWCVALAACLLLAAGVVAQTLAGLDNRAVRIASRTLLLMAGVFSLLMWYPRVEASWRPVLAMAMAFGASGVARYVTQKCWRQDAAWLAAIFGAGAWCLLPGDDVGWQSWVVTLPLACAAGWLWQRPEREVTPGTAVVPARYLAGYFAWFVVMAIWRSAHDSHADSADCVWVLALAGCGLAGLSIRMKHGIQLMASMALPVLACAYLLLENWMGISSPWLAFVPVVCLLVTLVWLVKDRAVLSMPDMDVRVSGVITRILIVASWWQAWWIVAPVSWNAACALTAVVLGVWVRRWSKAWLPETWAMLVISAIGLLQHWTLEESWQIGVAQSFLWDIATAAAWLGLAVIGDPHADDNHWNGQLPRVLPQFAGAMMALVATQWLVQTHGWKGTAVLWTVLGFSQVSSGLWLRKVGFRQVGFALLALAVGKVFVRDIWDFAAFMRVASFLALGVSLLLLGLFYHRFAPTLKRWLEDER